MDRFFSFAELPLEFVQATVNNMGLMTLAEAMDNWADEAFDANKVIPGDYKQAHWYQPGDITYLDSNQKSIGQEFLGRHWPVPDTANAVDRELFRNNIKPPTQVFRKYGITANEVMMNRFRRYLGSEFTMSGKTVNELFEELVTDKVNVEGLINSKYSDLADGDANSLTVDGSNLMPFKIGGENTEVPEDIYTQRKALMNLRSSIISNAVINFLQGYVLEDDGSGNMIKIPIKYHAPKDAQDQYRKWVDQKQAFN